MKFTTTAALMAALCSTSTMAMFISNGFGNGLIKSNGFVNGFGNGLIKSNGFVNGNGFLNGNGFIKGNGFVNGFVKSTGFVNRFDNGLVKNTGFINGFDNGLVKGNGLFNGFADAGLSVARISSVQTNFPNQVVSNVENIATLPAQVLPFVGKFDH